jgi:hypothetical protein
MRPSVIVATRERDIDIAGAFPQAVDRGDRPRRRRGDQP